jgi:hypothetical protein
MVSRAGLEHATTELLQINLLAKRFGDLFSGSQCERGAAQQELKALLPPMGQVQQLCPMRCRDVSS